MLKSETQILIKRILKDIMGIITQFFLSAMILGILIITIYYFFKKSRKNLSGTKLLRLYWKKLLIQYLFCVYSILVVFITYLSRETGSRNGLDLKLFSTISNSPQKNIYALENILLFIPLGILLPLISVRLRYVYGCVLLGVLLSLAIEFVQLFTQRGFWQIDDVIMNGVGTFVGYCINYFSINIFILRKMTLHEYRQINK